MSNFSKFLKNNEELRLIIKLRSKNLLFHCLIFIGFPLIFFLLYPMSSQGRRGLSLWLGLIFILLILIVRLLMRQKDCYLLTDQRIIQLTLRDKAHYQKTGDILLLSINKMQKKGKFSICLSAKKRNFYLKNIKNRDQVYHRLIKIRKRLN
jgi:hypothetical protein